jgi:Mn2+/Fe2+ NRAMP family transporter
MRATVAYTAARIVLFAAAAGVLYLIGARGLILLALALLVSGLASYVVLSKARDRMSAALAGSGSGSGSGRFTGIRSRVKEFGQRLDDGAQAEDEDRA